MNNIFNTSFEVSLRILIILNTVQTRLSIDRITDLDFIAIYGKDFGVSEYNLHGDNDYRFSEYTSKREIVSQAIKELVLRGYVKVKSFAPRQIQRRSFAALAITLSRKIF